MARKLKSNVWITFPTDEDVQFKVRPFSIIWLKLYPGIQENDVEAMVDVFSAMILDWKGINDDNDNPLECNDENKKLIGETNFDFVSYVLFENTKDLQEHLPDGEAKEVDIEKN